MKTGNESQVSENKIISLCKNMLSLLNAEHSEIDCVCLDNLERYAAQKDACISEMRSPANNEFWTVSPEETKEIQSLLQQIVALNTINEKALLGVKEAVMSELSGLQKTKTATRAYTAK